MPSAGFWLPRPRKVGIWVPGGDAEASRSSVAVWKSTSPESSMATNWSRMMRTLRAAERNQSGVSGSVGGTSGTGTVTGSTASGVGRLASPCVTGPGSVAPPKSLMTAFHQRLRGSICDFQPLVQLKGGSSKAEIAAGRSVAEKPGSFWGAGFDTCASSNCLSDSARRRESK